MPVLQESKHISWHGPANFKGSVCSIWTFCQQKNWKVLWLVSVDVVWLLSSCLLIQLMKRKRVRWKQEMTPLGNEMIDFSKHPRWLEKESSILSKRIVGAKRENRRCSWEVSQYTLRSHLTAMYREVIIRDKNIVKWRWCIRQTSLVGWLRPFPKPLCLPSGSRHADRADSPMVCLCMWLQKKPNLWYPNHLKESSDQLQTDRWHCSWFVQPLEDTERTLGTQTD